MTLRRLLSLLGILILLAALAFAVYHAQQSQETRRRAAEPTTSTISDNFDGASLDTGKWAINGTEWQTPNAVTQSGGRVNFSTGTVVSTYKSAGVGTNSIFTGDYSAEVSVSNLAKSGGPSDATSVAWTSLVLANDTTNNYNTLGWWIRGNGDKYVKVYNTSSGIVTNESDEMTVPISTSTIKLKLTRIGSTIQGFVDMGSGYQLIGAITNAYSGDGNIQMDTFADPVAGLSASASYDDFLAQVTPVTSASPSSLPDIGGGEDCDAPISPQNVKARTGTKSGEIIISWIAAPGASHYGVTYGPSSGNYLYGAANVGNVREFVVRGLNPGSTYYLVATAVNECGGSPYSNETSAVAFKASISPTSISSPKPSPSPSTTTFIPSLPSALPTLNLPSPSPPSEAGPSPEPSAEPQVIVEPETPQGPNKIAYLLGGLAGAVIAFFFIRRHRQKVSQGPTITQDLKATTPPPAAPPPRPPSEAGLSPSAPSSPPLPPPTNPPPPPTSSQ